MNVLEIKDRHGKSIKLTAEQWKHILLHKVMSGQLENIRSALEFPETIRQSNTDDGVKFYYKTSDVLPALKCGASRSKI